MLDEFEYLVLTIIDCPIDRCSKELQKYLNEYGSANYKTGEDPIDFSRIYISSPPKGGAHMSKILIWQPENTKDKTGFFVNYEDGRYTLILNYCSHFNHKAAQVTFARHTMQYPAFMFRYFDFENDNSIERAISLIKDVEEWKFFTIGPEQVFEDPNNYKKKRKRERLNVYIILNYLLKLGIDINNEMFWRSTTKGIYLTQIKW